MADVETILVDTKTVGCNGGGGPLGHPLVYLNLSVNGRVECPYCSRLFVYSKEAAAKSEVAGASHGGH
ncbi:MAG TPA: zinc-finger domain-containing protein [Stellaceae bacterium]|nr:zinc-finger domain-containing protein [Stellaceae bacterium]